MLCKDNNEGKLQTVSTIRVAFSSKKSSSLNSGVNVYMPDVYIKLYGYVFLAEIKKL